MRRWFHEPARAVAHVAHHAGRGGETRLDHTVGVAQVAGPASLLDAARHSVVGVGARHQTELEGIDTEPRLLGESLDQRIADIAAPSTGIRTAA